MYLLETYPFHLCMTRVECDVLHSYTYVPLLKLITRNPTVETSLSS